MTLLGGESLLNDATALTAYKVALAAAIGRLLLSNGPVTFISAAAGSRHRNRVRCVHRVRPRAT